MTKNVCFYHRIDLDGMCSGAIYDRAMRELSAKDWTLYGINYGDEIPWDLIEGSNLTVIDWAFQPWEQWLRAISLANTITWIDHHRSAIREWETNSSPEISNVSTHYDEEKAGCELAWDYYYPGIIMPEPVYLLGRYDVWDHDADERVLPYQYGMRQLDLDPVNGANRDLWEAFLGEDGDLTIDRVVSDGRLILDYQSKQDAIAVESGWFPIAFAGHGWQACNTAGRGSKLFDSIRDKSYAGMISFSWKRDKWVVGLYSDLSHIDCGAIAKQYGGGGHFGAAGFMCDVLPFNLG